MAAGLFIAGGLQLASGLMSYKSKMDQYELQKQRRARNSKLINEELETSYAQNLYRAMQEVTSMRASLEDQQREYMKQRGTAQAAAANSGASGNSADLVMGDLEGQFARKKDRTLQQYEWNQGALSQERKNLFHEARRAKEGLPSPIKPSPWADVLNTGASVANTYMAYGGGE